MSRSEIPTIEEFREMLERSEDQTMDLIVGKAEDKGPFEDE